MKTNQLKCTCFTGLAMSNLIACVLNWEAEEAVKQKQIGNKAFQEKRYDAALEALQVWCLLWSLVMLREDTISRPGRGESKSGKRRVA